MTHKERVLSIKVEVCDSCLRACCWAGIFFCDEYMNAGIVTKTIGELKEINKLRGLPWNYQGSNTKVWDNLIKRITGNNEHPGFNDYAVLLGRFVVFVGLLIFGLW